MQFHFFVMFPQMHFHFYYSQSMLLLTFIQSGLLCCKFLQESRITSCLLSCHRGPQILRKDKLKLPSDIKFWTVLIDYAIKNSAKSRCLALRICTSFTSLLLQNVFSRFITRSVNWVIYGCNLEPYYYFLFFNFDLQYACSLPPGANCWCMVNCKCEINYESIFW